MASSAFPGFESSETRGSGSPLSRGTDSLQPPMTEAGFSHAYQSCAPRKLRALLESALIWFDGEEREVHTLEPNDHERSQHWQKQPSPASPAFCNPWAQERLGNISFSNYIAFAQLCSLKNKNKKTICMRPVSRPHSHRQPTAGTLAGFFWAIKPKSVFKVCVPLIRYIFKIQCLNSIVAIPNEKLLFTNMCLLHWHIKQKTLNQDFRVVPQEITRCVPKGCTCSNVTSFLGL